MFACGHNRRMPAKGHSDNQNVNHSEPFSLAENQHILSSAASLITHKIIAFAVWHLSSKMKAVLWGFKLKPHAAKTRYIEQAPTASRRQIYDSAKLSQSITSSRQTRAISGGGSWEPSTNRCDEVSYRWVVSWNWEALFHLSTATRHRKGILSVQCECLSLSLSVEMCIFLTLWRVSLFTPEYYLKYDLNSSLIWKDVHPIIIFLVSLKSIQKRYFPNRIDFLSEFR